jgi:hypothetical protein
MQDPYATLECSLTLEYQLFHHCFPSHAGRYTLGVSCSHFKGMPINPSSTQVV